MARRIDALEEAVGRRVVRRGRSGTDTEPDALPLVRLAEDVEHGLGSVSRDALSLAGTVKVSVPEGAVRETAEALLAVQSAHPEITIELFGDNKLADLAKREADIGLRIAKTPSSVLVEKHVGTLRMSLYASADYVQHNLPTRRLTKKDAARHPFIRLDERWKDLPHERWMVALGAQRFPFRSSSVTAILEAVKRGAGIGAFVDQVARTEGLVRIDVESEGPAQPLYLVYHRELRTVPRIKLVIAALEAYLRAY